MNTTLGRNRQVDENLPDIVAARKINGNFIGAVRNRAYIAGDANPSPTTPNAAAPITFLILQTTAKVSGVFFVTINVFWTDASGAHAAGDIYTFNVLSQTGTGAVTISNAAAVTNAVGTVFVSNAAAGMAITAGGGGGLLQYSTQFQQAASASTVSGNFTFSNIVQNQNTTTVETPFPIGNNVFVTVNLNASAHVPALTNVTASIYELGA